MDESIIVEKLLEFGLTRQEAVIYMCRSRRQTASKSRDFAEKSGSAKTPAVSYVW